MNNQSLIEKFYTAFQNRDAETMVECYHDDIEFSDPAFGSLKGDRAKGMWRMLCKSAADLTVKYSNIEADNENGKAHWQAYYTFSKTGRKVHNIIAAEFEFKNGKIIKHTDNFNLRRWAGQAMGFSGRILGGTSFFKKKLQKQTSRLLDKFMES